MKNLDERCEEKVAMIVGSAIFASRLGGVDCSKTVDEYDKKSGAIWVLPDL